MKHSKMKYNILLLLALLSLVSIGFASWSIDGLQNDVSTNVSGSLEVDDVISGTNYLKLKTNPEVFKYSERGFVNSDGDYIKNGYILLNYELDIDKCREVFNDLSSLYITLSIEYASSLIFENGKSLFDSFEMVATETNLKYQQSLQIYINNQTFIGNTTINNSKHDINFMLKDYLTITTESTIDLTIKYDWNIDDNIDYFKNNVFPIIYDINNNSNKLSFLYNASISGN